MIKKYPKSIEDKIKYVCKVFRKEELEYIGKEQELNLTQKKELESITKYLEEYKEYHY